MRGFEVADGNPREFLETVKREISEREYDDFVAIRLDDGRLIVEFSWMGRTSLTYRIEEFDRGFRAVLERRRVSPFHAPFKAGFEERFDEILAGVGARSIDP